MSAEHIKNIVDSASIEGANAIYTVSLVDFLAIELPPRELLLSPWLPKAGLCMIHAYRGIGKTHLSLGVAYAVAKGGNFLKWQATAPRKVLFVDGEMPAATLQERLSQIIKMSGDSSLEGQLNIITPDLQKDGVMPDIGTLEGQERLNQVIPHDIDLIILDNISCLAPSLKENDASDWSVIQTWVLRLRAQGKSVLMIHHSGKAGGQRGTSKREDVLDTVITLVRPADYEAAQGARFVVQYEKSRGFFGEDAEEFLAHLVKTEDSSYWKTMSMEQSTYEKVYTLANNGLTQKEISEEIGIHKSNVSRYLTRARQDGKLRSSDNDNE